MKTTVKNIRYGNLGEILFECCGHTVSIAEPRDVLLVGHNEAAAGQWIVTHYGYMLAQLTPAAAQGEQ